MKIVEDLTLPKVGREYQHIDDLCLVTGASGAYASFHLLDQIYDGNLLPDVKWDGRAVLRFGRVGEQTVFGDKYFKELSASPAKTYEVVYQRTGSSIFASEMKQIHQLIADQVKFSTDGKIYEAGLMYFNSVPVDISDIDKFIIQPNTVNYKFPISKRFFNHTQKVGLVLAITSSDTYTTEITVEEPVVLLPLLRIGTHRNRTDEWTKLIESGKLEVALKADALNALLEPKDKFSDMNDVLYRFKCSVSSVEQLSIDNFLRWSTTDKRISDTKRKKLMDRLFDADFVNQMSWFMDIQRRLYQSKRFLCKILDNSVSNHTGLVMTIRSNDIEYFSGEGYVMFDQKYGKLKLVDRTVFSAVNSGKI